MNKEEKEAINMIKSQKENVDECLIAMENPENYVGEDVEKEYLGWQKNAEIILNLIRKQAKIIDKMADYMKEKDIDEDICTKNVINPQLCNEEYSNCKECIKEYFKKEVEKDVKD